MENTAEDPITEDQDENDVQTDWVRHWQGRPHGPRAMRSAAHTLIVDAAANLRAGCENDAEKRLEIAADLLVKSNDADAGVYDADA